jgi:hypothetical protein
MGRRHPDLRYILNATQAFRLFKSNSFEPPSLRSHLALEEPFQQVDVSPCHASPATWADPTMCRLCPLISPLLRPHPSRIQPPSPTTATGNNVAGGNPTTSSVPFLTPFTRTAPGSSLKCPPASQDLDVRTPTGTHPASWSLFAPRQSTAYSHSLPTHKAKSMKNPATATPHK